MALRVACRVGSVELVNELLACEANPNEPDILGWTAFYGACFEGHTEVVELLLNDKRININKAETSLGQTPFNVACRNGHIETVKLLLNDKRVNINEENYQSSTPFLVACQNDHIGIVKLLLKDQRIDVNKSNIFGQSPFYQACEKGRRDIVKLLLSDKRIDINKASGGITPLMVSCFWGNLEIVRYILASGRGVDLNARDDDEKTAIDITRESGEEFKSREKNCEIIIELLESFQQNQNETISRLRIQLGLAGKKKKQKLIPF